MPTWDAGGFFMDFATGVGFLVGIAVVLTLVLLGGDLRMFYDAHADRDRRRRAGRDDDPLSVLGHRARAAARIQVRVLDAQLASARAHRGADPDRRGGAQERPDGARERAGRRLVPRPG